jgi:hypothetical protein
MEMQAVIWYREGRFEEEKLEAMGRALDLREAGGGERGGALHGYPPGDQKLVDQKCGIRYLSMSGPID